MALEISKADVWAGEIKDQPGGAADVLGALACAGADLEFVIARRQRAKAGTGVLFAAPIKGAKQAAAARKAGLKKAESMAPLRVAGPDKPGAGAKIMRAIAEAGINCRGMSAARVGKKYVLYLSFDSKAASAKAAGVLRKL